MDLFMKLDSKQAAASLFIICPSQPYNLEQPFSTTDVFATKSKHCCNFTLKAMMSPPYNHVCSHITLHSLLVLITTLTHEI